NGRRHTRTSHRANTRRRTRRSSSPSTATGPQALFTCAFASEYRGSRTCWCSRLSPRRTQPTLGGTRRETRRRVRRLRHVRVSHGRAKRLFHGGNPVHPGAGTTSGQHLLLLRATAS